MSQSSRKTRIMSYFFIYGKYEYMNPTNDNFEIAAMSWTICDAQRLRNRHWLLPGVTYYYKTKNCSWNVVVHQMWTCTYIIGEGAHYAASVRENKLRGFSGGKESIDILFYTIYFSFAAGNTRKCTCEYYGCAYQLNCRRALVWISGMPIK